MDRGRAIQRRGKEQERHWGIERKERTIKKGGKKGSGRLEPFRATLEGLELGLGESWEEMGLFYRFPLLAFFVRSRPARMEQSPPTPADGKDADAAKGVR